MSTLNKYNNYEQHPYKEIKGFEEQIFDGKEAISGEIEKKINDVLAIKGKAVVCFDLYPGVDKEEIKRLTEHLSVSKLVDTQNVAKTEKELTSEFEDFITNDRVFGIICNKKLSDFWEAEKLLQTQNEIQQVKDGIVVVYGVGAGLFCEPDLYIYCNLTRWEIQRRYRAGMPNYIRSNSEVPTLTKYKLGFFIEWRLADRHKKARYDSFDYMLETEKAGEPKLITGAAFRAGLEKFSKEPFRLEPYFDPGIWGGHWMQEKFGLSEEEPNFAWSFDGVPEENSINFKFGDVVVKVPAIDLVLYRPHELLGERVHGRFGAEFPIRFDLLDTMGGGNLSLQVHPLTEYIQEQFGMHYTQDESYYLLDADENKETVVYLGVKEEIDRKKMAEDLRLAEAGEIQFPAEKYINQVPVRKHDHILIPAGTIHCSGKDTMVLEISATPYIFTFKLWDWGRVGQDGIPRPIHVEHGLKNIQWDRDTNWIYENLVHQEEKIWEDTNGTCERTGLHNREFLDTFRYSLHEPATVMCQDSVHVMNLVEGRSALIESPEGKFEAFEIHYAETAIVPACVSEYRIVPIEEEIKLIVAMVRK